MLIILIYLGVEVQMGASPYCAAQARRRTAS